MNVMRTHLLFSILVASSLLLIGCVGPNPNLTPDQLIADAKKKDATVTCATYDTLPTDVSVMAVNVDKGVVEAGSLEVKCGNNSVSYSNTKASK